MDVLSFALALLVLFATVLLFGLGAGVVLVRALAQALRDEHALSMDATHRLLDLADATGVQTLRQTRARVEQAVQAYDRNEPPVSAPQERPAPPPRYREDAPSRWQPAPPNSNPDNEV